MTNPNGRAGSKFETDLVIYARDHGYPHARRLVKAGRNDIGDISLGDHIHWTIEAKNEKTRNVEGALREGEREADNAGNTKFMAIHKARGLSIAQAHVTFRYWQVLEMLMDDKW
jgi:hypothetical protein